MAGDLIRFVDSIASSPTLRLDLNDETSWWVKSFDAPPPRLRRSMSENAMRDGISVGSSSYGSRTLTIELECRKSTQDLAATEMQKLWRELDRAANYLMYQPTGATKPVFFRTFRSDASQLADVIAQSAMRTFTIEVLAEPFALGLKESLGPYTVNNNPAAASNGCYVDLGTILGDVPVPLVLWDDATTYVDRYIGITHTASAVALTYTQAESTTLAGDTTNPGGAADAAMSGTGTTNYVRTTFASSGAPKLTWTVPATVKGRYRILVFGRPNTSATTYTIGAGPSSAAASDADNTVTFISNSENLGLRVVVDLGIRDFGQGVPTQVGYSSSSITKGTQTLGLFATRTTGTGTWDWDVIVLLPAGGQDGEAASPSMLLTSGVDTRLVVDSVNEQVAGMSVAGDPTAGTGTFSASGTAVGGFPLAVPTVANRLFMVRYDNATAGGLETFLSSVSVSQLVTLAYWPRYLFVRPVST